MRALFSLRFTYGQLSERENTPSLMPILYFVKQKRFVGQGRLESLSLLCFMNQLRGEQTKKIEKKKKPTTTTTNWTK